MRSNAVRPEETFSPSNMLGSNHKQKFVQNYLMNISFRFLYQNVTKYNRCDILTCLIEKQVG